MESRKITESDIKRISDRINNEGIIDTYRGIKGVFRGEGYEFFKYLSELKSPISKLQKNFLKLQPTYQELEVIKNKIMASKMEDTKRNNLINTIEGIQRYLKQTENLITLMNNLIIQKLS